MAQGEDGLSRAEFDDLWKRSALSAVRPAERLEEVKAWLFDKHLSVSQWSDYRTLIPCLTDARAVPDGIDATAYKVFFDEEKAHHTAANCINYAVSLARGKFTPLYNGKTVREKRHLKAGDPPHLVFGQPHLKTTAICNDLQVEFLDSAKEEMDWVIKKLKWSFKRLSVDGYDPRAEEEDDEKGIFKDATERDANIAVWGKWDEHGDIRDTHATVRLGKAGDGDRQWWSRFGPGKDWTFQYKPSAPAMQVSKAEEDRMVQDGIITEEERRFPRWVDDDDAVYTMLGPYIFLFYLKLTQTQKDDKMETLGSHGITAKSAWWSDKRYLGDEGRRYGGGRAEGTDDDDEDLLLPCPPGLCHQVYTDHQELVAENRRLKTQLREVAKHVRQAAALL